mmetsp:Transcript_15325/g.33119  ORF Transcript_15325/g.33119 Transcript_15325/m.33119 type:complete len:89 (-) Transcript_15325:81-347(-)
MLLHLHQHLRFLMQLLLAEPLCHRRTIRSSNLLQMQKHPTNFDLCLVTALCTVSFTILYHDFLKQLGTQTPIKICPSICSTQSQMNME